MKLLSLWTEDVGGCQVRLVRALKAICAVQVHNKGFCSLCRVCLDARTNLMLAVSSL